MELTSLHRDAYGSWAGNPKGHAPDPKQCCVEVYDSTSHLFYQCSRKRGYGPENAYCKQHSPEEVKKRADKGVARYNEEWNRNRKKSFSSEFLSALKMIAEGHNDPRSLAREVIDKYEKGLR